MQNTIGSFQFDDLVGEVPSPSEKLEIFERPGIDGIGSRKLGSRSREGVLTSKRLLKDRNDALSALQNYQDIIGGTIYSVMQHGKSYGQFLVVSVEKVRLYAVTSAGGSITPDPTVMLECEWTLRI